MIVMTAESEKDFEFIEQQHEKTWPLWRSIELKSQDKRFFYNVELYRQKVFIILNSMYSLYHECWSVDLSTDGLAGIDLSGISNGTYKC